MECEDNPVILSKVKTIFQKYDEMAWQNHLSTIMSGQKKIRYITIYFWAGNFRLVWPKILRIHATIVYDVSKIILFSFRYLVYFVMISNEIKIDKALEPSTKNSVYYSIWDSILVVGFLGWYVVLGRAQQHPNI